MIIDQSPFKASITHQLLDTQLSKEGVSKTTVTGKFISGSLSQNA